MQITAAAFGYIVWLLPGENEQKEINEKILRLKEQGKVAILVSGKERPIETVKNLLKAKLQD